MQVLALAMLSRANKTAVPAVLPVDSFVSHEEIVEGQSVAGGLA